MSSAVELAPLIGVAVACSALGVARACFYRAQHGPVLPRAVTRRTPSPLALTEARMVPRCAAAVRSAVVCAVELACAPQADNKIAPSASTIRISCVA